MTITRVLVAPDKFKGSLTGLEAAQLTKQGINEIDAHAEVSVHPVADGGEGTLQAVLRAGYRWTPVRASGPLGDPVRTGFAECDGHAVIELADICGLAKLPNARPDPLGATSYGLGELIMAAYEHGCTSTTLAVGGSASTDGGAGMLQALGVHLLDEDGRELSPGGGALTRLAHVLVPEGLKARFRAVPFTLATDVTNPLLGDNGAAAVYGPQKGATTDQVRELETGLTRFADLLDRTAVDQAGAGAAGGVGYAALAVLNATRRSGAEYVLETTDLPDRIHHHDLVITGEGALDAQSNCGKAPSAVATLAREHRTPVLALTGKCDLDAAQLHDMGIQHVWQLRSLEPDLGRCLRRTHLLLPELAATAYQWWNSR
ncbi:glycerate kinase [Saccharopolyspora lacisalsi]|uniref:Glycerate kinase n=1 Tax=Halosaccharopolyspora lacisalsi TaxID=1000566 RepID=A0A839DXN6_9PSEU|nr:glycerate kinase [Halosaccharopolyspora lacisalsi]MBA8824217.1 glycerate kinase [Halosaccharopolyspora lacisalsi]